MNVPITIFASEKILEKIKQDKTLEQAKNMASMPGAIASVIVLADAHQGYGSCIGGVEAFDVEKGVVSPGQIGYDINCLSENSKVLSSFGYWKKIKDFEENYVEESLNLLDKKNAKLNNSKISLFLKRNSEKITKIKTKSGIQILATEEHPIYTREG